ncbi:hypothetical protein QJS10_CPA01g00807 [Acorus calamus]|uniref:Fe2OG dioxygenase domain-containing protein n=1 Tax=Acorus calamus TaxID=4465 RepID=A0AAV9FV78_ACOCL|nr:hypothetical protein QJS10_CPA01g00807 [Acorus calamus]
MDRTSSPAFGTLEYSSHRTVHKKSSLDAYTIRTTNDTDYDSFLNIPREQDELLRLPEVIRKKEYVHVEKVYGRSTNVLEGLELHERVFNSFEQQKIVDYIYHLQCRGQRGHLRDRTYSEPKKWMRGKGRVTLQFGCCYNYSVDKKGNPPGIIRDEEVDRIPRLFKAIIRRSVLVLKGNGADVAQHCVPGVHAKRIWITFRKMEERKLPYRFIPYPELERLKPLHCMPNKSTGSITRKRHRRISNSENEYENSSTTLPHESDPFDEYQDSREETEIQKRPRLKSLQLA